MKVRNTIKRLTWPVVAFGLTLLAPARALGHCDSLDGPVVKAAQRALDTQNPALVLIWVQPNDESEILAAFEQTLAVRGLTSQAKELADRFFFETVVRLHRRGESESFTGLKPAGRDLGPAIPAADNALDAGSIEPIRQLLTEAMQGRLLDHFNEVVAAKAFNANDVAAGREYVKAYVAFLHYVERLYETSITSPGGHLGETAAGFTEGLR
jgi:Family of unknown function (DUF6448)